MKVYARESSGYLQKGSGISWADCGTQVPSAWPGGDLWFGKRLWIVTKPIPTQNWRNWRTYLTFPTGFLGNRTIESAWLVFTVKERGADFGGTVGVYRRTGAGWGDELDSGDWNACTVLEGTLSSVGFTGEVWMAIDPGSIQTGRDTQFRLGLLGTTEPTDDEYAVLYGADDAERRPYLLIDTGSINDDVCTNLAEVLTAHQSDLAVNAIHPDMRHTVDEVPEMQIGWVGSRLANVEQDQYRQVTAGIWWIGEQMDSTSQLMSRDREQRQKADLITRILVKDRDCNGYCTGILSIEENLPDVIVWPSGSEYIGVYIEVTYRLEIGDFETL